MARASPALRFIDGIRPCGRALRGSKRKTVSRSTVVFDAKSPSGTEGASGVSDLARAVGVAPVSAPAVGPGGGLLGFSRAEWHGGQPTGGYNSRPRAEARGVPLTAEGAV